MKVRLTKTKQKWQRNYYHSTTHQAAEVAKEAQKTNYFNTY